MRITKRKKSACGTRSECVWKNSQNRQDRTHLSSLLQEVLKTRVFYPNTQHKVRERKSFSPLSSVTSLSHLHKCTRGPTATATRSESEREKVHLRLRSTLCTRQHTAHSTQTQTHRTRRVKYTGHKKHSTSRGGLLLQGKSTLQEPPVQEEVKSGKVRRHLYKA